MILWEKSPPTSSMKQNLPKVQNLRKVLTKQFRKWKMDSNYYKINIYKKTLFFLFFIMFVENVITNVVK